MTAVTVVYQASSGQAVSYGTQVADPLPAGLAAYPCTQAETDGLRDRTLMWDPATRTVVTRVLTPEEQAEAAAAANTLTLREQAEAALAANRTDITQDELISTQAATLQTAVFANNTQRDNAIRSLAQGVKILADQSATQAAQLNKIIRLVIGRLDGTD